MPEHQEMISALEGYEQECRERDIAADNDNAAPGFEGVDCDTNKEKMKSPTLSAMLLTLLVLSQQAQGAETEAAKSPLTEAEMTQCRAQRADFNENVRTFNAQLNEVKALETEIESLAAEIHKESAEVASRGNDAMQALNAKIRKNNELVERHDQMLASTKAFDSELRQRNAQFREACENRPLAQQSAAPKQAAQTQAPKTPPLNAVCGSASTAKDLEGQLNATLAEMRADEKRHQDEVDRVAKAQAKAKSWNKERQGEVWLELLVSPRFQAFEREKQPIVMELMSVLGSKPKSGQEECRLMQRIGKTLPAVRAINARQYAFMAEEIRKAK